MTDGDPTPVRKYQLLKRIGYLRERSPLFDWGSLAIEPEPSMPRCRLERSAMICISGRLRIKWSPQYCR